MTMASDLNTAILIVGFITTITGNAALSLHLSARIDRLSDKLEAIATRLITPKEPPQ